MSANNVRRQIRNLRRRRGQGMTEYIVLVGLIALVAIGFINTFRDKLKGSFDAAGNAIDKNITQVIQPK